MAPSLRKLLQSNILNQAIHPSHDDDQVYGRLNEVGSGGWGGGLSGMGREGVVGEDRTRFIATLLTYLKMKISVDAKILV